MNKKIYTLLFVAATLLTFSCEQKVKTSEEHVVEGESFVEDDEFLNYENANKMQEIESRLSSFMVIHSLVWEKHNYENNSELTQVQAYLNEDGELVKIVEQFIGGNYAPQGDRHYYLENNEVIGYQEYLDVWVDTLQNNYVENRTVYENGEAVFSQTRTAITYDDIHDVDWSKQEANTISIDKVMRLLNGTGEFETHFISIINANSLFLLLGEAKEDINNRYTTAVRVDEMTPFIEDLLTHREEYKFRPVNIKFNVVGGQGEPEFRVLTDISWKN